ncbi:MAG: S41 family peptidase [Eubacteriales bacterium]|jgi:carboxyl-terminal processing protease
MKHVVSRLAALALALAMTLGLSAQAYALSDSTVYGTAAQVWAGETTQPSEEEAPSEETPAEEEELSPQEQYDQMTDAEKFQYLLDFYSELHLDQKSKEELLLQTIQTLLERNPGNLDVLQEYLVNGNDPHNHVLTREEYDAVFNSHTTYGIGVQAYQDGSAVKVEKLFDGSAKEAGVLPEDEIIAVDGVDVRGKTVAEIGQLIKGEQDTKVSITILRNTHLEPITYELTRGTIHLDSVTYEVKRNVGYITVTDFTDPMGVYDFYFALRAIRSQGVYDLVIDVRDNSGGYLYSALNMANMLTNKKNTLMAVTHSTVEGENSYYTSGEGFAFDKIAVLVNGGTASSAEIFAGILKDLGVAKVIGTQTYGKARGQNYYELGTGHYVSVTVSDISLPVTGYYHGVGITPQQVVENGITHPSVASFYNFDYSRGNSEGNVQAAKQKLYDLGYFNFLATPTYDENIQMAITIFQNRHGLPETGLLDETTMRTIDGALMEYMEKEIVDDAQLRAGTSYARS